MARGGLVLVVAVLAALIFGVWWWAEGASASGVIDVVPAQLRESALPVVLPESLGQDAESRATPVPLDAPESRGALVALPESGAEALSVRVLHADGTPARRAQVALYGAPPPEGPGLIGQGELDEAGAWRHEGRDEPASLFVRGATPEAERFELPLARGEHAFRLPDGASISGRVFVNGEPPGRRFVLGLKRKLTRKPEWKKLGGWPRSFRIPGLVFSSRSDGFYTDPGGGFRLSGFATGSEVEFSFPDHHELIAEDSTPLPVDAPHDEVVLSLRAPSMLRGRVIGVDGQPDPTALLSFEFHLAHAKTPDAILEALRYGTTMATNGADTDAEGRFAAPMGDFGRGRGSDDRLVRMRVDVVARTADGASVEVNTGDIDFTQDHDLGDLQLLAGAPIALFVHDLDGTPVVGAHVRPEGLEGYGDDDPMFAPTADTDAEGLAVIDAGLATSGRAMVVADGFAAELVTLPAVFGDEPFDVLLLPDTSVLLRLHGPWESPESGEGWSFQYHVEGDGPIFQDAVLGRELGREASLMDALRPWPAGVRGSSTSSDPNGSASVQYRSARSELLFEGLRPHHPVTFKVGLTTVPMELGPCPSGILWEEELWLEPGMQRVVDIDLSDWHSR